MMDLPFGVEAGYPVTAEALRIAARYPGRSEPQPIPPDDPIHDFDTSPEELV